MLPPSISPHVRRCLRGVSQLSTVGLSLLRPISGAPLGRLLPLLPGYSHPPRRRALAVPLRLRSTSPPGDEVLSSRLDGLDVPTVWQEFSPLSAEHGSVNLGQGFPDWNPPAFAAEAFAAVLRPREDAYDPNQQYTRPQAHPPLAQELAREYSDRWRPHGLSIDPAAGVATAAGCTGVMYCALQGLLNPGDEAILLEPAFDIYASQIKMAGGVPRGVPLRPGREADGAPPRSASARFRLDAEELEAAVTDRTRVLVLNTPHNPTGKMFDRDELAAVAAIVRRHPRLVVLSDEVYEHIVFDPAKSPHVSFATLEGMFERTLTLSSAGKTFSATGWKVGWAVGPPRLVRAVSAVQTWVNFSSPTPNQEAVARCLRRAREPHLGHPSYYAWLAAEYGRKRAILLRALEEAGMAPVVPEGGFFVMGDTEGVRFPERFWDARSEAAPVPMPRDWAMSRWMTEKVGVTAIPPSAFYSPEHVALAENFLRFAFCKVDDTLVEAERRLQKRFGEDSVL